MLVLAPVMCILGGIAVSSSLSTYMKYLDTEKVRILSNPSSFLPPDHPRITPSPILCLLAGLF